MKTYEEVYSMLLEQGVCDVQGIPDSKRATIQCWLSAYAEYWKARAKLAETTASFAWNIKHNIPYNEYIIKRQEVEVDYYKRAVELIEMNLA
jgi:hypothetical protein